MDRREQRDGDRDPPHRTDGAHQRLVEVIQEEHLLAQELEAVEVLGPLVMLDARDGCLEMRDVRLDLDRRPIAEAALNSVAERPQ